jgi:metal-responsive CopG/Arc/MetJ family transcriptional regulator
MAKTKVAVTIDTALLDELDDLVAQQMVPDCSIATQGAVADKLVRMRRSQLAQECTRLDPQEEQALAEQGLDQEFSAWPEY